MSVGESSVFSIAVLTGLILFASVPSWAQDEAELILTGGLDRTTLERSLRPSGTRILAFVPEHGAALVRIPERGRAALARNPHLTAFRRDRDPAEAQGDLPALATAWMTRHGLNDSKEQLPIEVDSLAPDALVAPAWWDDQDGVLLKSAPVAGRPHGADWQNTSEYLAGRISLNLLLPESNGYVDRNSEDWSEALEATLLAETLEAVSDLATLYPGSDLSFTIHLYSGRTDARLETSYEAISRNADPSGTRGEDKWTKEVLAKLGYPDGSRLTRSRMLADQTRINDGSDWAVNLFVINSSNDANGRFADGRFAYAWLGGPHIVLTSDNSNWGLARFNWVLRHELHHAFFALDQYASSRCTCGASSGYLAGTNDNCENGCGTVEADVMINNVLAASEATRIQVGSYDADLDGTPDLLSFPPEVSLEPTTQLSCDGIVTLSGTAQILAPVNTNPGYITPRRDITLLHIDEVQLRVDGSFWQSGLSFPRDGAFDSVREDFDLSLSLETGRHQIEVRAVDNRGNISTTASHAIDIAEAAQPVGASLRIALTNNGPTLSWDAAPGASTYLIRLSTHPDKVSNAKPYMEIAQTSWSDANPGTVFYRVSAVDGCGRECP